MTRAERQVSLHAGTMETQHVARPLPLQTELAPEALEQAFRHGARLDRVQVVHAPEVDVAHALSAWRHP